MQTYIEQTINQQNQNNPILSNQNSQAITTSQYNIKIDKIAGIFYGFTGFEVSLKYIFRLRIKEEQIGYDSIQQTNTFKFQYQTWEDTQIIAAQSQILIFAQINCNKNGTYFLDDQRACTQNCPSIGYYNGQVIDPIEGNLNYCLQCDKSCQTCDGKTSQNCLSCQNSYYLFQKQCMACPEQCLNCNQELQCLSCTQKFPYYYDNQCFKQQPANTFCDQNKVCKNLLQKLLNLLRNN
ncbi:extracellular matrix-like protein, putative (macronuclear) [Tetrahymena thermophila SB210]|uniref:Extracellular matrix-like protein, putative n=1 Tax=Tetrahymena thermophila (strain SB210) TaxID=312017 RepID=Q22TQ2_TETTS|nr:extracellular matrix-like protein, putative [Tetrahymena thermophila SB210]EAR88655.1 extracellular matrix-like protein, putative [Tetrahymena thermophila SB210]|eukprot:XP_001008900.1 extracellular matrix-like protein, putative [Tetrahymena thermophila SB210]